MHVTIAICTWNRAPLLRQTLEGLGRVATPSGLAWDVLVVDNGSADETPEVIRSATPPYALRSVVEPVAGLSRARNRALAECRADYVLFTDDDVLADEMWLNEFACAAARRPDAAGFGGAIDPWFPVPPDPQLVEAFPALKRGFCGTVRLQPEGPLPNGQDAVGANMAFRMAAVGTRRFREDLGPIGAGTIGGDEIEFQAQLRQAGGQIIWVPTMRVRHYVDPGRMTLDYLLKFAEDAGRKEIRLKGIPPGQRVAGVPRWLIGKAVEAQKAALASRLRGRRAEALGHLRRRHEFTGMIKECWARRGQPDTAGQTALGWD